jgi:agmatinase
MIQLGIRSPAWPEMFAWTREQGVTTIMAHEIHEAPLSATIAKARAVLGSGPCYLSFDIDGLDPAFAPGTGTPEIGGLASWQAQAILRGMAGVDFRGADIVEVAPAYDVAEITALAAATMAWEYLCLLSGKG